MNSEEQYIFMLLTSIVNQSEIKVIRKQVDWDEILKISDFHNVLGVIYYGMLGIEKEISEDCADRFFQKYKKGLLLEMEYKNAERAIGWQLERHMIHALMLTRTNMYQYYPKREMGYIGALEIMVEKKDLPFVHHLMREMDYEEKENRLGRGVIYTRTPGINIVFYSEMPLGTKEMKKYFSVPLRKYRCAEKYQYIHVLGREEEYLYRAGQLVEKYILSELKVRDIMDIWQYRKRAGDDFQWKVVYDVLERSGLQKFIRQVEILSQIWFGGKTEEDCGTALELEHYIMSQGKENRWLDGAVLPYERTRLDFYRRDREEEWSIKKKEWRFPPRDYMMQLFPVLKKHPRLLPFFWLLREFRYYRTICVRRREDISMKLQRKWLDIREKWKAKFAKEGQAEEVQTAPENEADEVDMEIEKRLQETENRLMQQEDVIEEAVEDTPESVENLHKES